MNDIIEALKYVNISVITEKKGFKSLLFTYPKGFDKFKEVVEG